jgi:hypothetical protein
MLCNNDSTRKHILEKSKPTGNEKTPVLGIDCMDKSKTTDLSVYWVNHHRSDGLTGSLGALRSKDPLCYDTAKCFAVHCHCYRKLGVAFESFFQCCDACCDSYRRSAMQQNDDVHLWHIAFGICYRPIMRSDSVGMDAHPCLQKLLEIGEVPIRRLCVATFRYDGWELFPLFHGSIGTP